MSNWLKKIFSEKPDSKKPTPVTKPQRKIGINKNYDPFAWQKNRFKQMNSGQ